MSDKEKKREDSKWDFILNGVHYTLHPLHGPIAHSGGTAMGMTYEWFEEKQREAGFDIEEDK